MRIFSPGREGCTGVRVSCWAQLAILPGEYKITEIMIDLNNWYKQYQENPDRVEFEMTQSAARELLINSEKKIFRNGILYKIKFLYLHYTNKEY